uniref:Uncharacterized protein n=1 Tax=Oryza brachyantha TaxID=4533 RepID=J3L015_ORYBR
MDACLLGSSLADAVPCAVVNFDVREGGALVDGVEGKEVDLLDAAAGVLGVVEHADHGGVDSVLVLDARRPGGEEDHVFLADAIGEHLDEVLVDAELVQGEGARLVAAEHGHGGHLLDRRHALGDSALLGQAVRPDRHGDRQHGGHRDGDAADEEDEQVVDTIAVEAVLDGVHDDHLDDHPDGNGGDAEVADGAEHLLEVADLVGAVDEVRRLPKEGVHAGGDDDGVDLALLARRPRVDALAGALGHRQRLAGERRLVHLKRVALEEARVGRHDVAELNADYVAGDEDGGILLRPPPVAENLRLGSQVRHERLRRAAGVALLEVRYARVEQQQHDDPDEVLPIRRPVAAVRQRDRHDRGHFHHPRQRVPHEPQKLQYPALFFLLKFVRTEDGGALVALVGGETFLGAFEMHEHIGQRDVLLQWKTIN